MWSYWIDSSHGRRSRSSDWWNDSPLYSLVLSSTHSYDNNYHCSVSYEIIKERRDRKSTRLNSSHVAISYAVFCLKKKKRFMLKIESRCIHIIIIISNRLQ